MSATRYIYREEPLPKPEARAYRAREIEYAEANIRDMLEELRKAEQELQELRNSPLPASITVQVALNPGDEGYENAPVRMSPALYQGDFMWKHSLHPVEP